MVVDFSNRFFEHRPRIDFDLELLCSVMRVVRVTRVLLNSSCEELDDESGVRPGVLADIEGVLLLVLR